MNVMRYNRGFCRVLQNGVKNLRSRNCSTEEKPVILGAMTETFQKKLPYKLELDGDVDGQTFKVIGEGVGDATTGVIEGKYVCTEGEVPISWVSLITSLSYGAKCFVRYPNEINDFFKSTFPSGYHQERKITYENDGVLETAAKITMESGAIVNRINVKGTGFDKDGHVCQKNLESSPPSTTYVVPEGEGIRIIYRNIYPTKDGHYVVADTQQVNRPIRAQGTSAIPTYHHIKSKVDLSTDPEENKDHIIIKETNCAFDADFS
uniref:Green fluorescent protein 1 n=1 Tax=Anthomedusae sp. SL-2003 TaxID=258841 RepID=Q6RYS6_9CNID|nr:green fluorescent protein 1 [Anthomedusae sp. SL-2003]